MSHTQNETGPMTVILLGPPGAGKGTQACLLASRRGYRHLASGDLLRRHIAAATPLGLRAEPYVRSGALVPGSVVAEHIEDQLREYARQPTVIDGFPKTGRQARHLDEILARADRRADLVLVFQAAPDVLRRRLLGRDHDRCDDTSATIERRLAEFAQVPADLTDHYRARGVLRQICADAEVDAVAAEIQCHLSERTAPFQPG